MTMLIMDYQLEGSMIEDKVIRDEKCKEETSTLSLYTSPPKGDFPLEVLYECANQRYKLLRLLADVGDCETASQEHWIPTLLNKLLCEGLEKFYDIIVNNFTNIKDMELLNEWDNVSHFALRTGCARLFESLKWFIKQEVKLFYLRWYLLSSNKQKNFLAANNLTLNKVHENEILLLQEKFSDKTLPLELFKTRFQRASGLMKTRTVYLLHGWVYYTLNQTVYPLATLYEDMLNKSSRRAKAKYDNLDFDPRYSFLFRRISEEIKLSLYKYTCLSKSKINIKDLTSLSVTSFPLCMSILHHTLLQKCHLRNGGRFQYNLFLKGIGITLYDSIKFWRDIFTKRMSLECFSRHYLYGIRHNYGMLGKQADYPPLNCAKIMDFSPGPLDRHGCPFERGEREYLIYHLKRCGLTQEDCTSVLQLVENNLPQQACSRVFEIKHGVTEQGATSHPNIYFQNSQKLINKTKTEESNQSQSLICDVKVSSENSSESQKTSELITTSTINNNFEKNGSSVSHKKLHELPQNAEQCSETLVEENPDSVPYINISPVILGKESQKLLLVEKTKGPRCSNCSLTPKTNNSVCKQLEW